MLNLKINKKIIILLFLCLSLLLFGFIIFYNTQFNEKSEKFVNNLNITNSSDIIKLNKGDEFLKLGSASFIKNNFTEAIAYFKNAIEFNTSNNELALVSIGSSYYFLNDYKNAILFFERFPDNNRSLQYLPRCYARLENYTKAIEYFEKNILLQPNIDEDIFGDIALAYYKLGDLNNAKKYAEKSLEVFPNNKWILKGMGWSYYSSGDLENAKKYFEENLQFYPTNYESLEGISLTYYSLGDLDNAKKYYNQLIIIRNITRLNNFHFIYYNINDTNIKNIETLINYQKFVKNQSVIKPYFISYGYLFNEEYNQSVNYLFPGWVYYEMGNYDSAIKYFKRDISINSTLLNTQEAYKGLGFSYYEKNEYIQARDIFNISSVMFPNSCFAYIGLGLVELKLGNMRLANEYYDALKKSNQKCDKLSETDLSKDYYNLIKSNFI